MAKFKVLVPSLSGTGLGTAETKQGDIIEVKQSTNIDHLVSLKWLEPVKEDKPKAGKK